jgi:hypothetical protein
MRCQRSLRSLLPCCFVYEVDYCYGWAFHAEVVVPSRILQNVWLLAHFLSKNIHFNMFSYPSQKQGQILDQAWRGLLGTLSSTEKRPQEIRHNYHSYHSYHIGAGPPIANFRTGLVFVLHYPDLQTVYHNRRFLYHKPTGNRPLR